MLTSHEKRLVAHFLVQMRDEQERILAAAIADRAVSGPLIHAYRIVIDW